MAGTLDRQNIVGRPVPLQHSEQRWDGRDKTTFAIAVIHHQNSSKHCVIIYCKSTVVDDTTTDIIMSITATIKLLIFNSLNVANE